MCMIRLTRQVLRLFKEQILFEQPGPEVHQHVKVLICHYPLVLNTSMAFFPLVPEDICQLPAFLQMLSKVSHPITRDFDQFSWSKVHHLHTNVDKLVRI